MIKLIRVGTKFTKHTLAEKSFLFSQYFQAVAQVLTFRRAPCPPGPDGIPCKTLSSFGRTGRSAERHVYIVC